ncbi:MAG: SRPBCC family protein [Chitinophagales bacterium]
MKWLKRIAIGISLMIMFLLILALFTKKEYEVEREIIIHRPKQEVFDSLKILENQVHYNPWILKYPSEKMEFHGKDGEVGFRHVWNSEITEVGAGDETIVRVVEGREIDIELHFIKPFDRWANSWLITDSVGNDQTKIRWGFKGTIKYPLNTILIFVNLEKVLGEQLSAGLSNAKQWLESN